MSDYEHAWAAGFFDGEGCTTFSCRYMYMQVKQVDEYGLRRFHAAVNGIGKIHLERVKRGSPIFVWRAGGRHAMAVMELIGPHLSAAKREQYDLRFGQWDEIRRAKDYCRAGHARTPDNLRSDGVCRTCARITERERYWTKKRLAQAA